MVKIKEKKKKIISAIILISIMVGVPLLISHLFQQSLTPPVIFSGTNLVSIPDGWTYSMTGQQGIGFSYNPSVFLDNSVLFNGQSAVRIDASLATNNDPETDSSFHSISAGDHIVFSAYVKVTSNSVSEPSYFGAGIGMDFYGKGPKGYGRICGVSSPTGKGWTVQDGYPSDNSATVVPFGTSSWTYVSMDFVVPAQYEKDPFTISYGAQETTGTSIVPQEVVPWLFIYTSPGETAKAWFADTQFYINPSSSSHSPNSALFPVSP